MELCTNRVPDFIEKGLYKQDGVYRVVLFKKDRKLSIRYDDTVCSYNDLCLRLNEIIEQIPDEAFQESPAHPPTLPARGTGVADRWANFKKNRLTPIKNEFERKILHLLTGNRFINKRLSDFEDKTADLVNEKIENIETKVINVLNEFVLLYLIKLHWDVITNNLMKAPLKNINNWLVIFYLMYLYSRSKE